MTSRSRSEAEVQGELALDAFHRGEAAAAQDEIVEARRWLERARRLVPPDPSIALSLASVLLMLGDAAALPLFGSVAHEHDVVGAWLGAAASARLAGETRRAARDLAQALSAHAIADFGAAGDLARVISEEVEAPGWCCLAPDRRLHIRVSPGQGRPRVEVDGAACAWHDGDILPGGAGTVAVTRGGRHLLGSPLRVTRMFRIEGVVRPEDDGVYGWAWHPGAPHLAPVLELKLEGGWPSRTLTLTEAATERLGPFVRARRIAVPASELPPAARLAWVRDGTQALVGSPVLVGAGRRFAAGLARGMMADPAGASVQADILGRPAGAAPDPLRPVAIVIPVHRGARTTLACIASVRASLATDTALIVIDDASPEPALATALDGLAAQGAIRLIRRPESAGFPSAANAGLRAAAALPIPHDVVLLNSDTLVLRGWLQSLRKIVHSSTDIGTATPLSNDATLASYPVAFSANPPPSPADLRRLGGQTARVNRGVAVDIPTAVGFCMYIRRECLDSVGLLDEELFAQGYGEENDFCLRARHLGWRHVAAAGVFVAHIGGVSFGAAKQGLLYRNAGVMARRHPGYAGLIAAHRALDPLAPARFRLDAARWAAGRRPAGATILITHDSGGGVARAIDRRCAELRAGGKRAIVLRPVRRREGDPEGSDPDHVYRPGLCEVSDGPEAGFPNLRFQLPPQLDALARLLRRDRPEAIEVHHLLGHHHDVTRLAGLLGIPIDIHVHDYACICPRITLVGPERRFCGEPLDTAVCDACVADIGRVIEEPITPAALRARSAADFAAARRILVPARDVARRLDRHFPGLRVQITPFDDAVPGPPAPLDARKPRRVAVIGGIGVEKGYEVLLGCARDAVARALPLEFVVVGHTLDDARLFDTGRVFVTGPYAEADGLSLLRSQRAHLAWLPSICPETWSFTLSLAWSAGLAVAVADIGVLAERVRAHPGGGWVLPLGAPIAMINNALLAASPRAGDECTMPRRSLRRPD